MSGEWRNRIVETGEEEPSNLLANPRNFRRHPTPQQNALRGVLNEVGWVQDVIVNRRTGHLIDGHLRVELAMRDNVSSVPVKYVDLSEEEELLILATFDPISALAFTDKEMLESLLHDVSTGEESVQQLLADIAEKEGLLSLDEPRGPDEDEPSSIENTSLNDKFIVPPFSVLDARQGYWQARKHAWLSLGIVSELGREDGLISSSASPNLYDGTTEWATAVGAKKKRNLMASGGLVWENHATADSGFYIKKRKKEKELGRTITSNEFVEKYYEPVKSSPTSGTSIFDPVLCELAYRWFIPPSQPNATVLDPFAGGSVRGVVAGALGISYTGIDLSAPQIEANRVQWDDISPKLPPGSPAPVWINGDSTEVQRLAPGSYDLIFTCPPYADLEVYSDDPRDISNMSYPDFLETFRKIISSACALLKEDRFAIIVIGDVRSPSGPYRNLVSDTISAVLDSGLSLYNDAILLTILGSLPARAGRPFRISRKLGKTHQNVIIGYKGDPEKIKTWGEVECGEVPDGGAEDE